MAEYDIGCSRIRGVFAREIGPDDQIINAVAIDIARRVHGTARLVEGGDAAQLEPAIPAVEGGEIDIGAESVAMAEHDISGTGVIAVRVRTERADDEIVISVLVQISSVGHAESRRVIGRRAGQLEAV